MAQAPALPRGFELPLEPRLPRIGSVDQVALEERAATLARRSIKKESKLWALELAVRMMDLTTLEGADTPGKVGALCSKAVRPDPVDPTVPSVAAVCVYPNLVPIAVERLRGSGVKVASVATGFPSGQSPLEREARGDARGRGDGRGRGRHGDRPRRLPVRPVRKGLRRDRSRERGLRRRACEGDPRDRGARDVRQRAPCLAARHGRRRGLHQDLHREGSACGDAAGHPRDARGDPRRVRRDRPDRRHEAGRRHPAGEAGDPVSRPRTRDPRPDWLTPDLFRFGASTLLNDVLMQIRKQKTGVYQSPDYFTLD